MANILEIENLSRRKFLLDSYTRTKRADGTPGTLVRDPKRSFVLGDAADKVLPHGAVRGPKCPSPIVRVSMEFFESLDPAVLDLLAAEKDAGRIVMGPAKDEEPPQGDAPRASLVERMRAMFGGRPVPAAPAQPQQPAPSADGKGRR